MKKALIISLLSFAALNAFAQPADNPVKINATCKVDPGMPANAVRVWPKSAYTPMGDASCAPCYEYTRKSGIVVMECPFLSFPPEGNVPDATVPTATAQTDANSTMDVQSQNTYTGNYPVCKKLAGMPANAKLVWPQSAYTPTGNPACAPCYEYTRKSGIKVMECPNLMFPPEK